MVESSIGSGLEFEYTRDIKPVFFSKYCQMGSGLKLFKQKGLDQDNMKYLLWLIAWWREIATNIQEWGKENYVNMESTESFTARTDWNRIMSPFGEIR